MSNRVSRPDHKVNLALKVFFNPPKRFVDQGQGRVAIRALRAEISRRSLAAVACSAFLVGEGACFVVLVGVDVYSQGLLLTYPSAPPSQRRCKFVPHVPVICKKRPRGPEAVTPAGGCCTSSGKTWALESLPGLAKGCCSTGIADDAAAWAHRASSRIVDRIFAQTARTPNGVVDRLKESHETTRKVEIWGKEPNLITDARHCAAQGDRQSGSAGY